MRAPRPAQSRAPAEEPRAPAADPAFPPQCSCPVSGGSARDGVDARSRPWPPAPRQALRSAEHSAHCHPHSQPVVLKGRVILTPSLLGDFQQLYVIRARRFSQKKVLFCLFFF